jgi:ABC-type sugar transport system substrate-binding protein
VVFLSSGTTPAQLLSKGLASASSALHWNYSATTFNQANPATLISAFQSAIQGGANVVVVQATSSAEYQQLLPMAQSKGVLVIDQASSNSPTPGITALIDNGAANGKSWGNALAAETLANSGGKPVHAAVVTAPIFGTISDAVSNGYAQALHKKCPQCTSATIPIPAGDIFTGQASKDIISYLQTHPNTGDVVFITSLLDVGARAALNQAGFNSVKIFGNNALAPNVAEIKNGQAVAWLDQPLEVDGWMSMDAAARAMTGGNPGLYYSRPEPTWLLTNKTHFTGNTLPEVPFNYQSQFKKMWKIKQGQS